MKRIVRRLLSSRALTAILEGLTADCGVIFLLHRVRDRTRVVAGHDPEDLDDFLGVLRGRGYTFLSLPEMLESLSTRKASLHRIVSFTFDDGYDEQAAQMETIFAAHGCPVTTFLSTHFLDGRGWMWWDRIRYILNRTEADEISVRLNGDAVPLCVGGVTERSAALERVSRFCIGIDSNGELEGFIGELSAAAGVAVPEQPPTQDAPMTWGRARELEGKGMSFAPHTVTHCILSRVTPERSRSEIVQSWTRLKEELSNPLPIFAYPNGLQEDFGLREIGILRDLGFTGAVTAEAGYNCMSWLGRDPDARFQLRRFGFPSGTSLPLQYTSGAEYLKRRLRGISNP